MIVPATKRAAVLGAAEEAAESNGLLNNLIAFWPGNEAAGNALDAHTNGLDLTDNNTVTSNPGNVYALARQYTAANSEYHARPGDDALLSMGDVDFTLAAWVYQDSKGATRPIMGKDTSAGIAQYQLDFSTGDDRYRFWFLDNTGALFSSVLANNLGSPALSTWYLIVAWHDATANTLNIQVNNGAANSAAELSVPFDGDDRFELGARTGPLWYWDGRISPSMVWKSAAGGGGVLTAAQRTQLYNSGNGLPYSSFTA